MINDLRLPIAPTLTLFDSHCLPQYVSSFFLIQFWAHLFHSLTLHRLIALSLLLCLRTRSICTRLYIVNKCLTSYHADGMFAYLCIVGAIIWLPLCDYAAHRPHISFIDEEKTQPLVFIRWYLVVIFGIVRLLFSMMFEIDKALWECVCVWMEMGWPENENVQIDVFHLSHQSVCCALTHSLSKRFHFTISSDFNVPTHHTPCTSHTQKIKAQFRYAAYTL